MHAGVLADVLFFFVEFHSIGLAVVTEGAPVHSLVGETSYIPQEENGKRWKRMKEDTRVS